MGEELLLRAGGRRFAQACGEKGALLGMVSARGGAEGRPSVSGLLVWANEKVKMTADIEG